MTPAGYTLYEEPRPGEKRGGGVAVLCKASIKVKKAKRFKANTFESMNALITSGTKSVRLVVVYRPPSKKDQNATEFLAEFGALLETLALDSANLIIVGDFNIHMDDPTSRTGTANMFDLLAENNLTQRVYGSTHRGGHTLDLILTRATESTASNVRCSDPGISYHKAIVCSLHVGKPPAVRKLVSVRNYKLINVDNLCKDLLESHDLQSLPDDVESAALQYDSTLRTIIDKHAPVKSKAITIRSEAVWYTEEIHDARRIRRKLERKWRKSGLEVDFQIYTSQRQAVTRLVHETKTDYYCADIQTNAKDSKLLFKTVDTLLHKSGEPPLPACDSPSHLANTFQDYFLERVALIHQGIQATLTDLDLAASLWGPEELPAACSLTSFRLATHDDIRQMVSKAPPKSCELDSIPTWLLKQCGDGIIPSMTSIINMSLESGVVPGCFKKAVVRPLLKKPRLDAECLKNYRPVSNLSFISKQTERVVAARLNEHMSQFDLFEPLQSAYKARHSCETALIHVQNNIMRAMDQGKVGILLLLDMSAAFETVDHNTLLNRLHTELGIGGTALDWFESYLVDRHQVVSIRGEPSDSCLLRYRVPQGSVLGPQLFTVYISPLGRIIRAHDLDYHLFADDSQLYVFVKPVQANVDGAIGRLEKCCHDIRTWMRSNFLKLNDGKTEVLLIGSRQQLSKIALTGVTVGESLIAPATTVRDLGAVFDMHMTMVPHVTRSLSLLATISETLAKSGDSLTATRARRLSMPLLRCAWT